MIKLRGPLNKEHVMSQLENVRYTAGGDVRAGVGRNCGGAGARIVCAAGASDRGAGGNEALQAWAMRVHPIED